MDGISSTPIENSVQFLRLRDKYKSSLLDDSRLTKAAGLAVQKELLLESPAPDTWKEPRLKSVNRELQQWVKKIRQPGGTQGISPDEEDSDEDEGNLAVGPLQQFMGNISKISRAIKRKAEPVTPQSVLQHLLSNNLLLPVKNPSFPLRPDPKQSSFVCLQDPSKDS